MILATLAAALITFYSHGLLILLQIYGIGFSAEAALSLPRVPHGQWWMIAQPGATYPS